MCASITYMFSAVNSTLKVNMVRKILTYWGRNTIVFIGFNYIFNLVLSNIFKFINMEASILYCIVDVIMVMFGCTIISFIWNHMRSYMHQK